MYFQSEANKTFTEILMKGFGLINALANLIAH